ncbi:MAG TPA: rhodanese-like domain-containing protein [Phycisphaerales bacterium]|nr:rhodanese-like domain-containing protein [Phycisphaerales bacterium]
MRTRNRLSVAWIRTIGAGTLAGAALSGCSPTTSDLHLDRTRISTDEVRRLTLDLERQPRAVVLLDARSEQEYRAKHIAGARRIELTRLPVRGGRDPELESFRNLVVYGNNRGTATTKAVGKRLMELEYKNVRWFADGLDAWVAAGYPTTTGE